MPDLSNLEIIYKFVAEFIESETLDLNQPHPTINYQDTMIYIRSEILENLHSDQYRLFIGFYTEHDNRGYVEYITISKRIKDNKIYWYTNIEFISCGYLYRTVLDQLKKMGLKFEGKFTTQDFKPIKYVINDHKVKNFIPNCESGYILYKDSISNIINDDYSVNKIECKTLELEGTVDSMINVYGLLIRLGQIKREIIVTFKTKNSEVKLDTDDLMKYENLSELRIICNNRLTFKFNRDLQTRKN